MTGDVACVVLASGFSRRYGADKLLERMTSGQSMIEQTVALYRRVFQTVYVVARPDNFALINKLNTLTGVILINNTRADLGMSQSVVAAVKSVHPNSAWLFALADMPYLNADTVSSICSASKSDKIVQPVFNGTPGNPVSIGVSFRDQLLDLHGDLGAKQVVKSAGAALHRVDCQDLGIHQDIDTPNDWVST